MTGPKHPLDWVLVGLFLLALVLAYTGALWSFAHQAR